jgi:hypothetical protein
MQITNIWGYVINILSTYCSGCCWFILIAIPVVVIFNCNHDWQIVDIVLTNGIITCFKWCWFIVIVIILLLTFSFSIVMLILVMLILAILIQIILTPFTFIPWRHQQVCRLTVPFTFVISFHFCRFWFWWLWSNGFDCFDLSLSLYLPLFTFPHIFLFVTFVHLMDLFIGGRLGRKEWGSPSINPDIHR